MKKLSFYLFLLTIGLFANASNSQTTVYGYNDTLAPHLLMKVVVKKLDREISNTNITNNVSSTVFYIRTAYNSSKDIILTNYINGNQLLSFKEAFVGDNTLSDSELMTSPYLVSSHTDSTAPLFFADTYWHIFGQHGCPMPRFANEVGMTSADVGAEWKDQLDRHYHVGYVDANWIYLVPIMYQDAKGHWVRDWKNTKFSDAIISLTHVSGGLYTLPIPSISNYGQVQLRPVMSCNSRKWIADGKEITEPGTYYCNNFNVSETAVGYDPATITLTDWFSALGNNVELKDALPMAEFSFDYNYKGAQCCVNTTINILREVECRSYGATQQQFFHDNGDYKAMFMIPKAKSRNGVEIDKPFNSPAKTSQSYGIYRTTAHLKNVDDPVDRQIGYLYNPNTGDYLVGMAAGLSLVSGETVKEKRIQNCPVGNKNAHWSLLSFSPSNTNKFYIAAINTAQFEDNDYYLPAGYSKEINYYVSYYDPSENTGQVYWYKDGNDYIIYAHCQERHNELSIQVPSFMDGASLSVVEKTDDAELLSETIQNGKFNVSYNTADANYIVLKATMSQAEAGLATITAQSYTREYGDANPVFEYTSEGAALDGEPVIVCEATETSPVGTYDIMVQQGTVKNYNVNYVGGTLTITKAPLTIKASEYTMKQGDALPEFIASYEGFKNNETEAVLTKHPTLTTTATSESEPGTYDVVVTGAEAQNYAFSYMNGTLTITKADPVTISVKSYTREYGDANPVFEYTSEGAALDGEPVIVCEAAETSPVGTYDIVVKQGTVKNYNVNYVGGTLTITKAPLAIKAGEYTMKQGDALPEFIASYEGFKKNETEAVLTKHPTLTTTATSESEPGTYDVVVTSAEAQNYAFSYMNGTLTITKADPVTISVKSYTREYGDANPVFEYTSEGAALDGEPEVTCEATETSPVGTYDIVVKRGMVKNYNVNYVGGTLTITKAPLTVKAGEYTMKQGDTLPEFIVSYEGWKNDETEAVLIKYPMLTTTATSESEPGTYVVEVAGAEAQNYAFSYIKGTLTITEADPVTITANSYIREYGDANPVFEYTSEGAALDGEPVIVCEAAETSPVGTYDIVVKQGTVKNYNVNYVDGTLTIAKAPLTVSVGNYTREYGQDNPEFTLTYSDYKNGENESVLSKKPTATTEATIESPVGEYVIKVRGGSAQNYSFEYVDGVLTVTDPSGINNILRGGKPFDVYNLTGEIVYHQVKSISGIPHGIYIVYGHVIFVR